MGIYSAMYGHISVETPPHHMQKMKTFREMLYAAIDLTKSQFLYALMCSHALKIRIS